MMDREMEKRVWQRVMGMETDEGYIVRLIRLSALQVQELRQLDPELYRRERMHLGLLTGLWQLSRGGRVPGGEIASAGGSRKEKVRRCRDRCHEMLTLTIRLERHPRYGTLFTDLTRYRRACCALLEQLAQDGKIRRGN